MTAVFPLDIFSFLRFEIVFAAIPSGGRKRVFIKEERLKKNVCGWFPILSAERIGMPDVQRSSTRKEILRKSFYSDHWEYEKAKPYRIFISQATYPIKGFHIFLKALALVKERYPQVDVTISGLPPFSTDAKGKILVTGYGKYLQSLIKKHDLSDVLHFIGEIDEQQMKQEFLACNVFVSASVIENESNSVSEAKILGVPVISSYVGGVAERICHLEDGILYPFEEFYMLAYYIMKLFEDVDLCKKISNNARVNARKINDPQKNISDLKRIYCKLIERGSNDHDS